MNFEIVSEEELFENEIFSEIESQEENEEMDGKFLLFLSNKSISVSSTSKILIILSIIITL